MSEFRNMLMAKAGGGKSILPEGYTECEYLESTGKQWIDSEVKYDNGIKISASFRYTTQKATAEEYIFGINLFPSPNENARLYFGLTNALDTWIFGVYSSSYKFTGFETFGFHNVEIVYGTSSFCKVDNILVSSFSLSKFNRHESFFIFASRNGDYPARYATCRIYGITFALQEDTIRNFIPALDNTGRPCMYDTVSKTPFYNQGTGEFLYKIKE